ncbi:GNAT family N-acetyltransferase [Desulfobacterales bacterium HSG17]|nr:GNAT family N-acetyltransferase [Desulfobacterales bacterium HSG17]
MIQPLPNGASASGVIEKKTITPELVMKKLKPGMNIFISTGASEPRTLIKQLTSSKEGNIDDLTLIQLVSFGDILSSYNEKIQKFRLKTFFSGYMASNAIKSGWVDFIPCRFANISNHIESGQIPVDVAFIQVSPPNEAGYCSMGLSVDVARQAMDRASLVVGEINPAVPVTLGDTFVPLKAFDCFVESTEDPFYFSRIKVSDVYDRMADNIGAEIPDGSCISFSLGPLHEALGPHLMKKNDLSVHTAFFTDALMELVTNGSVTNRNKNIFRGKSIASYAIGTKELYKWLHRNPLVDFQGIDKVFSPIEIGKNNNFVAVLPAFKANLSGKVALRHGSTNVAISPSEAMDFFNGAHISKGGFTMFALPSRNSEDESNIVTSIGSFRNQFSQRERVDMIATEYGVAHLSGKSIRERAQALIEIAHPDDRETLMEQAKDENLIYQDQIFIKQSAHLYPSDTSTNHMFKNDLTVRFRAIKPSDEEEMRHLFYRFSDEAVYYRYFTPIKSMSHAKMQEYVNVDFNKVLSVVGLVGDPGQGLIIAEGRFVKSGTKPEADMAFVVDEKYQGRGIASFLYQLLMHEAKKRGIHTFTADVLSSNMAMMKVFEKGGCPVTAKLDSGIYELRISLGTV